MKSFEGKLVDIVQRRIYPARLFISNGRISKIEEIEHSPELYVLPGFVDAHVHIESSMVTPYEFSRASISHGTIGIISDPHEIANVLGKEGVRYMIKDANRTPQKIMFGAPSCVPATPSERSGAILDAEDIREMLDWEEIGFLSEMMNYPGVIHNDKEVHQKLEAAIKKGYPIDGHAPGVRGDELKSYADGGISTDHECFTMEEAEEKIALGMKVLIREGSSARNFDALIPLLEKHPDKIMFCTDDLHPDDLLKGHINLLVKRALLMGYDLFDVLAAASLNAVKHYSLPMGMLQEGDAADWIVVDDLQNLDVLETIIDGTCVFSRPQKIFMDRSKGEEKNNFQASTITTDLLRVANKKKPIKVIEAIEGELITRSGKYTPPDTDAFIEPNPAMDVLKIVVLNRYEKSPPAIGFISGFGLTKGALASSIAHDSHNIICVGASDQEIADAINWVIEHKGGIAASIGGECIGLPLGIAGIISTETVDVAAALYAEINERARNLGSEMKAPLMTLAFMALLVIPELKLGDRGLFDGKTFSYTSLFVGE